MLTACKGMLGCGVRILAFCIPPDIESSFRAFVVANEVDILLPHPSPPLVDLSFAASVGLRDRA
jgi:hypothetical protein